MTTLTPRQEAWQAAKAAKRVRAKTATLLHRLSGMRRADALRFVRWLVCHPAKETGGARPVRVGRPTDRRPRRERRAVARLAIRQAPPIPVDASTRIPVRDRVPRGKRTNPTVLL